MRNASENGEGVGEDVMRATFEVPRSLVAEFRKIAEARERTFSAELRKLMADEIARVGDGDAA